MGRLVISSLDGERRGVDADLRDGDAALTFDLQRRVQTEGRSWRTGGGSDLDGGGPVGVHLSVLVVVTLELQLQVGPGDRTGSEFGQIRARSGSEPGQNRAFTS